MTFSPFTLHMSFFIFYCTPRKLFLFHLSPFHHSPFTCRHFTFHLSPFTFPLSPSTSPLSPFTYRLFSFSPFTSTFHPAPPRSKNMGGQRKHVSVDNPSCSVSEFNFHLSPFPRTTAAQKQRGGSSTNTRWASTESTAKKTLSVNKVTS